MIDRYQSRISGPLLDRIDMHVTVRAVSAADLSRSTPGESSAAVRERVVAARQVQEGRNAAFGVTHNAHLTTRHLAAACPMTLPARRALDAAMERLKLSARAHDRLLKLSRTLADLAGRARQSPTAGSTGWRNLIDRLKSGRNSAQRRPVDGWRGPRRVMRGTTGGGFYSPARSLISLRGWRASWMRDPCWRPHVLLPRIRPRRSRGPCSRTGIACAFRKDRDGAAGRQRLLSSCWKAARHRDWRRRPCSSENAIEGWHEVRLESANGEGFEKGARRWRANPTGFESPERLTT